MENTGPHPERERLDRWVHAIVGLVGDQQLSHLLQRTVEATRTVVEAASASLETPASPPPDEAPDTGPVLRVPLIVHEAVFGHVRLVGSSGADPFSADDEELVRAVLSVAGVNIERITLKREHRRERWVVLLNEIAASLMAGAHSDDVLRLAASGARELARADLVAACVAEPNSGRLEVRAADGQGAEAIVNSAFDAGGSASQEVIAIGEALLV
ncbi:MAG: hypothetical protein ACRDZW_01255, partial [Acidimicrobiales bacterium]